MGAKTVNAKGSCGVLSAVDGMVSLFSADGAGDESVGPLSLIPILKIPNILFTSSAIEGGYTRPMRLIQLSHYLLQPLLQVYLAHLPSSTAQHVVEIVPSWLLLTLHPPI